MMADISIYNEVVASGIEGFSGPRQWAFFSWAAENLPCQRILMLGVYRGFDIALLAKLLLAAGREEWHIDGVDLFKDAPISDWTEEQKKKKKWQSAMGVPPPSLQASRQKLKKALGPHYGQVTLYQTSAESYLARRPEGKYDWVYIDTSHDYESTLRQIDLSIPVVKQGGWLAGDDFAEGPQWPTWGVPRAVKERFGEKYRLFANWVWLARKEDYLS